MIIFYRRGKFEDEEKELAKRELGMPDIPMNVYPRPQAIPSDSTYFKFPGAELYVLMQRFMNAQVSAKALLAHDALTTWFSDWQVAHGRVSHLQIRVIINNVKIAIDELGYIEKCLSAALNNLFDKSTADEWLGTYLDPLMKQLCETRDRGNRVLDGVPEPPNGTSTNSVNSNSAANPVTGSCGGGPPLPPPTAESLTFGPTFVAPYDFADSPSSVAHQQIYEYDTNSSY